MNYFILKLKKKLIFRLDLREIVPNKLKNKKNIKNLEIFYGNEKKRISDFFSFQGKLNKGIIFKGNFAKCDYIGDSMKEGEIIIVKGHVGNRLAFKMRSGIIFVKGNVKNYIGSQMIAGTIIINGKIGSHPGLLMKRGTIVLRRKIFLPLNFKYSGKNNYLFLKVSEFYLKRLNIIFKNVFPRTYATKFTGDTSCNGNGEIFILN